LRVKTADSAIRCPTAAVDEPSKGCPNVWITTDMMHTRPVTWSPTSHLPCYHNLISLRKDFQWITTFVHLTSLTDFECSLTLTSPASNYKVCPPFVLYVL
jgi:hypothetical protein